MMPSRKRKQSQVDLGLNDLSSGVDGFAVAFNPSQGHSPSTYHNPFDSRLDLDYVVVWEGSTEQWNEIKSYTKFSVPDENDIQITIPVNSFVYVRGLSQTKLNRNKKAKRARKNADESDDDLAYYDIWVAHVLECRATDSQHVYLRVAWLYWPKDLQGFGDKQQYHGDREVIPSNDIQIINAITVCDVVEVKHWSDSKRPKYPDDSHYTLFWRQTLDVRSKNKPVPRFPEPTPPSHCVCREPANPDDDFVYCGSCDRWMHAKCIEDAAIEQAAQKGTDGLQGTNLSNGFSTSENPRGLIARLVDTVHKVRHKHDTMSPPSRKLNQIKAEEDSKPSEGVSTPNKTPLAPLSEAKENKAPFTLQRRKKGKMTSEPGKPSFQAELGEPKSDRPDCGPTTITLSKHKNGTTKTWEQPIFCLFEDCGKAIS